MVSLRGMIQSADSVSVARGHATTGVLNPAPCVKIIAPVAQRAGKQLHAYCRMPNTKKLKVQIWRTLATQWRALAHIATAASILVTVSAVVNFDIFILHAYIHIYIHTYRDDTYTHTYIHTHIYIYICTGSSRLIETGR